ERVKRLRYVDATHYHGLSRGALDVRNDADEEIGTLDGFVLDAASGAPRYIVVDASGLFSWRRSLLPVSLVRFDERARVLRIALAKSVAARCPAFDPDEFDAMDDEARRAYEGRLLDYFAKDAGPRVPPVA